MRLTRTELCSVLPDVCWGLGLTVSINDDFLEVFCSHAALSARTRNIYGITMVHAWQPDSLAAWRRHAQDRPR
jgi:hypothetical protein